VNVIHTDIIEIWNLKDRAKVSFSGLLLLLLLLVDHREQSLSSTAFKEMMSHIVKDLAGSVAGTETRCVCFKHKM